MASYLNIIEKSRVQIPKIFSTKGWGMTHLSIPCSGCLCMDYALHVCGYFACNQTTDTDTAGAVVAPTYFAAVFPVIAQC